MLKHLRRRLLWAIPTLFAVTFLVFGILNAAPGDTALSIAGPDASDATLQQIRTHLHLDDPFLTRYVDWLGGAVHGDFGHSLLTNESVGRLILDALPVTLSIVLLSTVFALLFALVIATAPRIWQKAWLDRVSTVLCSVAISMPSFWVALLLVSFFAVSNSWFPALGYVKFVDDPVEWFTHLILPCTALALGTAGEIARQLGTALDDALEREYTTALRAKGLTRHRVVLKHALKNAAVPVVTVLGVRVAQLLGGTVIIEQIFLLPGLGRLMVQAVLQKDIPVVLGVVVVSTVVVLCVNLVVDASHAYFNPRVRTS